MICFGYIFVFAIFLWNLFTIYRDRGRNNPGTNQKQTNPTPNPPLPEKTFNTKDPDKKVPVSLNFHFTRKCNYECGFCFHTAKTSYKTPLEEAKRGLKIMADLGMKKLNLSGGEPFLYWKHVGEICQYSKAVLGLQSVSIVSNVISYPDHNNIHKYQIAVTN